MRSVPCADDFDGIPHRGRERTEVKTIERRQRRCVGNGGHRRVLSGHLPARMMNDEWRLSKKQRNPYVTSLSLFCAAGTSVTAFSLRFSVCLIMQQACFVTPYSGRTGMTSRTFPIRTNPSGRRYPSNTEPADRHPAPEAGLSASDPPITPCTDRMNHERDTSRADCRFLPARFCKGAGGTGLS